MASPALPKQARVVIIGGGVIGCEYACIFNALGVHVTVVEKRGGLVGGCDLEIAASLQAQMESAGIRFLLNDSVDSVKEAELVHVHLTSGEEVKTHAVLVSSGRCGNTEALALDNVGIAANERGQILVNAQYQTSVPHVYAAGDVAGPPLLAHWAQTG